MTPTEDEGVKIATEETVETLYRFGLADTRRVGLPQWKAAFARFPKDGEGFRVTSKDLNTLSPLFFKGNIKKPFDPKRLKDGPRPSTWLDEIYQKVLRFETKLSHEEWKKIVAQEINPRFVKGTQLSYTEELRAVLLSLLEQYASPLRRLELWVEEGRGPEAPSPIPIEKKSTPVVVHDAYQAKPIEIMKKNAIDKLYYHHEQQPKIPDDEVLDLLDELANLEGEDEDLKN